MDITRVFGQLNTSSQYNSDMNNEASGRNGLGAKLVNIMSEMFIVQVENPGIRFTAVWK